jgi:hypothetical protein
MVAHADNSSYVGGIEKRLTLQATWTKLA